MSRFNDYYAFTLIVETLSITKAADQLNRTVSAVSKQLTKLECHLGVQLIDRSTQSLSITALGKKFYSQCKEILNSVECAEQSLKDELVAPAGKLKLSFPDVLLNTAFMDLLESFNIQFPLIKFDLKVSNTVDDIIDEGIDFAFRIGNINDSRLTAISLARVRPVLCASPAYLKRSGQPKSAISLLSENRAILPTYVNVSEYVKKLFPAAKVGLVTADHAHTTNSEVALHSMLLRGLGAAMLLDITVDKDIRSGKLVELFPSKHHGSQQIYLIFSKRNYMPAKMELFKDFIKANFSDSVKALPF